VSFNAITLCVTSQRVFIVVSVHFVIESVRKLLEIPSYLTAVLSFKNKFRTHEVCVCVHWSYVHVIPT
jgi:hypothetical protein